MWRRKIGLSLGQLTVAEALLALLIVALLCLPGTQPMTVLAESQHSPLCAPQFQGATSTPLPTPTATHTPTIEEQLIELEAQLQAAWEQKDWPHAIEIINRILQIAPNRAGMHDNLYTAHVNYGFQLFYQGRLEEAKRYFTRATEIRPDNCEEAKYGLSLIRAAILTGTPGVTPTATITTTPGPTPTGTVTPQVGYYHVVQTGDTLYSLAKRYGTSIQAIMQANGLTSYIIRIGQKLYIPPPGTPPPGPVIHTVLPGETLWSLARRYCTTVQAIMLANRLWDYMIYAGQLLIIPAPSQPAGPTQPLIHTVSSGETLFSIAQRYHTTVAAIMQANHLDDTLIYPGQLLIIPASN